MWTYLPYGPFDDPDAYSAFLAMLAAKTDTVFYALRDTATGHCGGVASYLRIDPGAGRWGSLRFDDSLDTVLGADIATPFGAQSMWRQVTDLIGRDLTGNPIEVRDHCYGCTAGQGSSCGGALDSALETSESFPRFANG